MAPWPTTKRPGGTPTGLPRFRPGHGSASRESRSSVRWWGAPATGANSMFFADLDGDGAPELFWGDLLRAGAPTDPEPGILLQPLPSQHAAAGGLGRGAHCHQRLQRALAGGSQTATESWISSSGSWGARSTPSSPPPTTSTTTRTRATGEFTLRTRRFLYGIDTGSESVPALGDLDGDGDLDLLVANKIDPGDPTTGTVQWFENVGSAQAPAFHLRGALEASHLLPQGTGPGRSVGGPPPGHGAGHLERRNPHLPEPGGMRIVPPSSWWRS